MFKGVLLTAALVAVVSMPMAANIELEPGATPLSDAPCHPVQPLDLACTMRVIDANGDGTISAAELASFAAPPPPVIDLAPRAAELSFKEVVTQAMPSMPTVKLESDSSRRLIPALFALGAMVVLLRRRPT